MTPATIYDKVWSSHLVQQETNELPAVLFIDLHLIHEATSPQAFDELARRKLPVRHPERTFATADHVVPTASGGDRVSLVASRSEGQVGRLRDNCDEHGIRFFAPGSAGHGIVHVIGPELGLTQPGKTIVCGDSHTSTHGAFGALAFGIGTTEVGHVLATQMLFQRRSKVLAVTVSGRLQAGVSAKDLALAAVAAIGAEGGRGHVIEFRGPAIRALDMEGRMTLCNMSIEAGARAGMVAPDDTTFEYLADRPFAPQGAEWDARLVQWRALASDEEAHFDREVQLDASELSPMVTYGTNPTMVAPADGHIPDRGAAERRALEYMGLTAGQALGARPIDVVFIGSCTNSRIGDLREAARVLEGRTVAPGVRLLVVPGSRAVFEQAEREGIADVFRRAGAEWRTPGCSMCIAMNGDVVAPGQTAVSTSNRNFEGRQGPGSRTVLASPATAAASAVAGRICDPRHLIATPPSEGHAMGVPGDRA